MENQNEIMKDLINGLSAANGGQYMVASDHVEVCETRPVIDPANVANVIKKAVKFVKNEVLSTRTIVSIVWDNRESESLKAFAKVLFANVSKGSSRKEAINAGKVVYANYLPFAVLVKYTENQVDKRAGKMTEIGNSGIYRLTEEPDIFAGLEGVLSAVNDLNFVQLTGEAGRYYTFDNDGFCTLVSDSAKITAAKKTAKTEKETAKEIRANETASKVLKNQTILALLNSALAKSAENADLQKAILNAIQVASK